MDINLLNETKQLLIELNSNNLIDNYTVIEYEIPNDCWRTTIIINELNLPLYAAYWYCKGMLDVYNILKQ